MQTPSWPLCYHLSEVKSAPQKWRLNHSLNNHLSGISAVVGGQTMWLLKSACLRGRHEVALLHLPSLPPSPIPRLPRRALGVVGEDLFCKTNSMFFINEERQWGKVLGRRKKICFLFGNLCTPVWLVKKKILKSVHGMHIFSMSTGFSSLPYASGFCPSPQWCQGVGVRRKIHLETISHILSISDTMFCYKELLN